MRNVRPDTLFNITISNDGKELTIASKNSKLWLHTQLGIFIIYNDEYADIFKEYYEKIQQLETKIQNELAQEYKLDPSTIEKILQMEGFQSLILEVTTACNMRCKYCVYSGIYNGYRVHGTEFMPIEIALKAVKMYKHYLDKYWISNPFREPVVGFYGGEPLLAFNIIKKVVSLSNELFRRDGYDVVYSITTNGTLINDKVAEFLARNSFVVAISLDGPKEEHDKRRKYIDGKGTFEDVMRGLITLYKAYKRNGQEPRIIIECVIDPTTNLRNLREFFNSMQDYITALRITYVRPYGTNYYERIDFKRYMEFQYELQELKRAFIEYIKNRIFEERREIFMDSFFGTSLYSVIAEPVLYRRSLPFLNYGRFCIPGSKLYVTVNGRILPCEKVSSHLVIGDVNRGIGIEKILDILSYVRDFQKVHCAKCPIRYCCPACLAFVYPYDKKACQTLLQTVIGMYMLFLEVYEHAGSALIDYVFSWLKT